MKVLAIDPGYDRTGIAVVEGDPSRPLVVWSSCVLPEKGVREMRLAAVHAAVLEALRTHCPDALALETLFFSTNKKTALGVAEARGAILVAAGSTHTPVIECSPQQVKLSITGNGRSDKKAIARMIPRLVALPARKRLDDELDAIGIGITALAVGLRP
jgi:crossover junction endodeoxyribonuclease RuvC